MCVCVYLRDLYYFRFGHTFKPQHHGNWLNCYFQAKCSLCQRLQSKEFQTHNCGPICHCGGTASCILPHQYFIICCTRGTHADELIYIYIYMYEPPPIPQESKILHVTIMFTKIFNKYIFIQYSSNQKLFKILKVS